MSAYVRITGAGKMKKRVYAEKSEQWNRKTKKNYFSERKCQVINVENGIVLPARRKQHMMTVFEGGVCNENFEFIAGLTRCSRNNRFFPGWGGVDGGYSVTRDGVYRSYEDVIFGGALIGHFGHFILECISSRLWYVIENTEDQRKIIFITELGEKKWFYDFFDLCEISDRVEIVDKPTQFRNITVPEESVHSWEEYTEKYPLVYKKICRNANAVCMGQEKYSKIYLSHSKWDASGPKCIGEDNFEEFFRKEGYKILHTEELPLSKQIYLVNNANEVFTTLGSLSHFAMFCNPGIRFVELLREYNDALDAQILINQASNVDWYVIDVSNNYLMARREQGVLKMHFTNEFKNFWQQEYGRSLTRDNVSNSGCDLQYIIEWTKYFSGKNTFEFIRNLSGFDFISRFSNELLGVRLNPEDYKRPDAQGELDALKSVAVCLNISLHVSNIGNVNSYDSQYIFKGHRIEAITLQLPDGFARNGESTLSYSVYIKDREWVSASEGEWAGTSGKNLPIQAISIVYEDEIFCPIYRIYDGISWSRWYREGLRTDLVSHMEAITVILVNKTVYKS